jgi:hypothetical protein
MNEELISKYKESLDLLKFGLDTETDEEFELYENKYYSLHNSNDILEKSFTKIEKFFSIGAQPYVKFILVYRNGEWYKYNSNNPYPIQLNLCILLTNNELFKLLKRTLYNWEKKNLINFFLREEIDSSKIENLKIIKNNLIILKNLSIDSTIYLNLKILLEYLFYIDSKHFVE